MRWIQKPARRPRRSAQQPWCHRVGEVDNDVGSGPGAVALLVQRLEFATLAVLVWQLGTGPFLDGLRAVDGGALAAASGIGVLTTVCCAWRWRIVARGLGVDLPLAQARPARSSHACMIRSSRPSSESNKPSARARIRV